MFKTDAIPREAVNVRRTHERMTVAAEAVVEVVGGDEEHVAPALRGGLQERSRRAGQTRTQEGAP